MDNRLIALRRILKDADGKVVTKSEIARRMNVSERQVDALAARLRHNLNNETVVNVWGVGFKLENKGQS
jgi:DNA-binding response OmpR family regulator